MTDRIRDLQVFVRALRLGGLSAAARELDISPAMASRHLHALEARLGVTLVHRTTRRLALTEAGAAYLDKAERILEELAEADAEVRAQAVTVAGRLRVSAPAAFGVHHVAGLVADFHRQYPAVTVELGLSDRYVDLVREGWDMAIRIGRLADSSLVARKLAEVGLCVCAAPGYLAERGTPRTLEDLGGHDCLGYTLAESTGTLYWGFGADGSRRVPVRGSLHADNGEALVRAAMAGQGLVYGPRFLVAQALAGGALVEVTLDAPLMRLGAVHAVSPARRHRAAKTRAWIDFLAQRIPAMAEAW